MNINILVIGLKAYHEKDLNEILSFLKNYRLKKLPSDDNYLIFGIPDYDTTEITEELEEMSRKHSNPAWEIMEREILNQTELITLPKTLYYERNK